jgi:hypothetical protein
MNRGVSIILLLLFLTITKVTGLYAQFENVPDSVYIAQMSTVDKFKLYKVALDARNPFLCMIISTGNFCGEAVVRLEDYKRWYDQHFGANNEAFLSFSISKLMGDTLFISENELAYNKIGNIKSSKNIKNNLDSCLSLCNIGQFDYDLIAGLFHANILIEWLEELEDDGNPYIRFPFYYYNGTSTPSEQTNKLLNESLLLFLDSTQINVRFYLEINKVFVPSKEFFQRYGDLLICSWPSWDKQIIRKIPNNSQVVSLDSFCVFDGDCILTYKTFVIKKVFSRGKWRNIAVNTRYIKYRYTYSKEQLDWALKSSYCYEL